ncbi:cell wall metabolism sensor histidine kinase WalK [Lactiplantibacillus plantarum]|uniref:cell wall metabolism sensor histidine kinase WalK n=1 Tax=Lactiplantibacillus plantarum TaxID=1590 RepID=UPI001B82BDFB|nr:cell wall metabolism sensor histidine kinase WalK [Lactiplantibacillus plantarum]MBR7622486.1 cell wall metabolism sensor histidine kinase WalK [Lactiplantibacillus plantarum]MBR7625117.1 cell wall metabolism sensor histidine kinase WalK [Lactiplantibacillus plantarum]MBR7643255.1 cell wall metabolism sensor histidine kinase WalK [Lactiplantibacillus plantarum]MCZ9364092.1 cell wall metabolism sensor histidine kinase WalK [Lactiplantibacillus plantarum]MCZ9382663.1 cell wall metabolism sens
MLRFKRKNFFKTINFKIALVFALLLLITLEIVGAIFVKQLESKNIQDFKQSVQIPTYIDNSLSEQLTVSSTRKANGQIKTILSNYNNTNVDEIQVVDSKGTIRGTSDVNDQSVVGQKTTDRNVKNAIYNNRTYTKSTYDTQNNGRYYVSIVPLYSSNSAGNSSQLVGVLYVRANMKSVYSTINNIMGIFVIASLAAMVLGLGIAIIIARAITRPIEEMKQQTQRIARGDYAGQVRVYSDDELGQLAKSINNLSIRVEESQESTEAERRRLDSVLSHMSDGVIATDRRGNITIINETASDFMDVTAEKAIGNSILDILKIRDDYSLRDLIENQDELMLDFSSNERDLILNAYFSLIQRESGFISGLVCVLHDVTEQQKIDNDRKQFVSNVSHELRTPLTSLRSYIEALSDGAWKDPEVAPGFLKVTQEETDRMIRMINELLSLSRMDSGTTRVDMELVNINEMFNYVLDRFDMILKKDDNPAKYYTIKREFTKRDLWVEIDTDKFTQVLDNIMNNAIKYSPDGGVVTCRLLETHNQVIISISDQGLGIPRADLGHVFDRFFRVDKARSRAQGGTGLGLAISKEVVQMLGGRIWVDSVEGKGSTFYISLPYEPYEEEDLWDDDSQA